MKTSMIMVVNFYTQLPVGLKAGLVAEVMGSNAVQA